VESEEAPWRVASFYAQAIPAAAIHVHHALPGEQTAARRITSATGAGLAVIQLRTSRNISVSKDIRPRTTAPAAPMPCPRAEPAAEVVRSAKGRYVGLNHALRSRRGSYASIMPAIPAGKRRERPPGRGLEIRTLPLAVGVRQLGRGESLPPRFARLPVAWNREIVPAYRSLLR